MLARQCSGRCLAPMRGPVPRPGAGQWQELQLTREGRKCCGGRKNSKTDGGVPPTELLGYAEAQKRGFHLNS